MLNLQQCFLKQFNVYLNIRPCCNKAYNSKKEFRIKGKRPTIEDKYSKPERDEPPSLLNQKGLTANSIDESVVKFNRYAKAFDSFTISEKLKDVKINLVNTHNWNKKFVTLLWESKLNRNLYFGFNFDIIHSQFIRTYCNKVVDLKNATNKNENSENDRPSHFKSEVEDQESIIESSVEESKPAVKLSGFAKAFDKFMSLENVKDKKDEGLSKPQKSNKTFVSLLRNSKLIQVGENYV